MSDLPTAQGRFSQNFDSLFELVAIQDGRFFEAHRFYLLQLDMIATFASANSEPLVGLTTTPFSRAGINAGQEQ